MRLKGIVEALLVGGFALLPAMAFGGRLEDNDFATKDATAADATNEASISVFGREFGVEGFVRGTSGGCQVTICYDTDTPHSASATALKTGKTQGNAKVSQSIFTALVIDVIDADGPTGTGTCTDAFKGEAAPEKCKATASMKGTSVATGPDTVQSSRVNVACRLEANLGAVDTNLVTTGVQAPTAAQADIVVAAFDGRKDVKISGKNDELKIKQKGIPDTTTSFCSD